MKSSSSFFALCAALGLAALIPAVAGAQDRHDRRGPGEGRGQNDGQVCVYEHVNYGGWEQCFGVGEEVRDLGNRRNRISSIRVRGRAEIVLYEHPNFDGDKVYIDSDVPDLGRFARKWNDEVDSLEVGPSGYHGKPGRGEGHNDRVCVYEHANFQGRSQCWDGGDDIDDLKRVGWNDRISSIRTFGRTRVAFFEHTGFQGERLVVDHDMPDLTQVGDGRRSNWNDRISSVRISGWR
jgi:hypothetical protein